MGRYRCADLQADASIAFEGEQLVLRISAPEGGRVAALEAFSNTVFGYTALDPAAPAMHAITVERKASQVTGLRLSSARARRLHFVRLAD